MTTKIQQYCFEGETNSFFSRSFNKELDLLMQAREPKKSDATVPLSNRRDPQGQLFLGVFIRVVDQQLLYIPVALQSDPNH